jgi:hypothetical protein
MFVKSLRLRAKPALRKIPGSIATEGVQRRGASWVRPSDDGTFRLAVLPGPGVLVVTCPPGQPYMRAYVPAAEIREFFNSKNLKLDYQPELDKEVLLIALGMNQLSVIGQKYYQSLVLIHPDEKDTSVEKDLVVEPGATLTGVVVGPDDKPVKEVFMNDKSLPEGTFTLDGINPRRPTSLYFLHKEKGLGFYTDNLENANGRITVRLQPCGSVVGRFLDADGQPVADEKVWIGPYSGLIKTGKDGRFRMDHLVAGCKYNVKINNPITRVVAPDFKIEPGKTKDLGDIVIEK